MNHSHQQLPPGNLGKRFGPVTSLAALVMLGIFQGCMERPSIQIDHVLRALQDARLTGAEEYAIEQLLQSESSYRQAIDELDHQDSRFVWWRTYAKAHHLLNMAQSQAEQAKNEALANYQETKENAELALTRARTHIQQIRTAIRKPSSDKAGTTSDNMSSAVEKAETLLAAMETGITQENYIQVMTLAHSVELLALPLQHQIIIPASQHSATHRQV